MNAGTKFSDVPDHPGTWSAWSPADAGPGAWFLVPADDTARAVGRSAITVRIISSKAALRPVVTKVLA